MSRLAGSRAASAGAFITLAAHVAAMAPGTNIGAAHPVKIGGQMDSTMADKVANDAAAYIRSIAEKRGRNVAWAEDLVDSLNGRRVELPSGEREMETSGLEVVTRRMSLRERFLATLSDPNVAYILMMLGFYGLLFEIYSPGSIFPGVIGSICIILAFFSFQTLPINYAGLILIIVGVVMLILEVQIVSHGALTIGGVVAMGLGSTMLFESPEPFLRVSWAVIIPAVIGTAVFILVALGLGVRAQKRKPVTGVDDMVGKIGKARTAVHEEGMIVVHGEYWNAVSDEMLEPGSKVRVKAVDGSTLTVERV